MIRNLYKESLPPLAVIFMTILLYLSVYLYIYLSISKDAKNLQRNLQRLGLLQSFSCNWLQTCEKYGMAFQMTELTNQKKTEMVT